MNAEECCRAIGCNCAGTTLVESFSQLPNVLNLLLVFGVVVTLFLIIILSLEEK